MYLLPFLSSSSSSLLGGVEVGESIIQSSDSQWKRIYRIRLMFEDPVKIKNTFGVDFSTIKKVCSSGLFYTKLAYLIQLGTSYYFSRF